MLEEKGGEQGLAAGALFPLGVQLILETLKMIENGKYSVTRRTKVLLHGSR